MSEHGPEPSAPGGSPRDAGPGGAAGAGAPVLNRISWDVFVTLAAIGLATAVSVLALPMALALVSIGLIGTLAAIALVDWRQYRIPDALSLPLLAAGLVAALTEPQLALGMSQAFDAVLGAAGAGACLWGLRAAYRRVRGAEGLGLGDVKLAAAGGAWLGWQGVADMLLLAAVGALGAVLTGALLSGRRLDPAARIPFGVALAASIWLVWLAQRLV